VFFSVLSRISLDVSLQNIRAGIHDGIVNVTKPSPLHDGITSIRIAEI
jgi:hypothetical protein